MVSLTNDLNNYIFPYHHRQSTETLYHWHHMTSRHDNYSVHWSILRIANDDGLTSNTTTATRWHSSEAHPIGQMAWHAWTARVSGFVSHILWSWGKYLLTFDKIHSHTHDLTHKHAHAHAQAHTHTQSNEHYSTDAVTAGEMTHRWQQTTGRQNCKRETPGRCLWSCL